MKHGVKKVKFVKGQDANQALMRKLLLNFLKHGHIETTLNRGKALKALVDRLMSKAIRGTESDKNVILKHTASRKVVDMMVMTLAPKFSKDMTSGFIKVSRMGPRQGDAAEVVRMRWVKDVNPAPSTEPVTLEPKTKVVAKDPVKAKKSAPQVAVKKTK